MRTFLFCSLAALSLTMACKKELAENNGGNNGNTPPVDTITPKLPKVVTNNLSDITYFSLVASGKLSDSGPPWLRRWALWWITALAPPWSGTSTDFGPNPMLRAISARK